jgi:hypothetical protein
MLSVFKSRKTDSHVQLYHTLLKLEWAKFFDQFENESLYYAHLPTPLQHNTITPYYNIRASLTLRVG